MNRCNSINNSISPDFSWIIIFNIKPVFIPGPTTNGLTLKYLIHIFSKANMIGGTTEEIIIPFIS